MAAYAWTPSALTWLHVNHLINGLHKQISLKNRLYADNLYFTLASYIVLRDHMATHFHAGDYCLSDNESLILKATIFNASACLNKSKAM